MCSLTGCEPERPSATLDTTPLPAAQPALSRSFDHITGVVSLSDTLGLLVDRDARTAYLINWKTETVTPTGHEGSGPGEFRALDTPFPGGSGNALIQDWSQRRVIGFDGTSWSNAADLRTLPMAAFLHGGDRDGNLYFEYRPISHEGGGTTYADSALILRLAPNGKVDTVAHLLAPEQVIHVIRQGTSTNSMAFEVPYSPRDVWVVIPEGGVAILRSHPVRLERVTDDSVHHASVFNLPVIEVQERDKSDSLIPVPKEELPPWPAVMPPFVGTARLCGDDQRFIVRRPGHIGDSTETWLQLSAGKPKPAAFTIPEAERVVGCDGAWLYTARPDSNEMEMLVRYGMR